MAKRGKELTKILYKAGWVLHRQNGRHEVWRCICDGKHTFIKSTSGRGGRVELNQRLQLRRTGCAAVKDI